jgi:hypothetical protein
MLHRRPLSVGLVLAVLVAGACAGTSTATRSIQLTPQTREAGRVEDRSRELTFTEENGNIDVRCEVTKTLAVNNAISKVAGSNLAQITAAAAMNCRNGRVRFLSLPWNLRYVAFTGTLPNIRELVLKIGRLQVLIEAFGGLVECLYSGEPQMSTTGSPITGDRRDGASAIALASEALTVVTCPANLFIRGSLTWNPSFRMALL